MALQDALGYDEPPAWYYPVRESLGAALVRAGRGGEGETVFREGLKRSPRNGWMLFGLMASLKAQGKSEGMEELQRELDAVWVKADVKQRWRGCRDEARALPGSRARTGRPPHQRTTAPASPIEGDYS